MEEGGILDFGQAQSYQKAESLLVETLSDLSEGRYWEVEMKLRVVELCLQEALGI